MKNNRNKTDAELTLLALGRSPIAFHQVYSQITLNGKKIGACAGLFLSQAVYLTSITKPQKDGWFYKTALDWEKETGLTETEQQTARTKLKKLGILKEIVKKAEGNPTVHYKLNTALIVEFITDLVFQELPKPNPGIAETSTETTTENIRSYTKSDCVELGTASVQSTASDKMTILHPDGSVTCIIPPGYKEPDSVGGTKSRPAKPGTKGTEPSKREGKRDRPSSVAKTCTGQRILHWSGETPR